jgi:hypothetical protein
MAHLVPEQDNRHWQASSHSGPNGDCLEAAEIDGRVWVRDSHDPTLAIVLTHGQWRAFLKAVKEGHLGR